MAFWVGSLPGLALAALEGCSRGVPTLDTLGLYGFWV